MVRIDLTSDYTHNIQLLNQNFNFTSVSNFKFTLNWNFPFQLQAPISNFIHNFKHWPKTSALIF